MRILVYENRKSDPAYYDVSTPEQLNAAYLTLFADLDSYWDVYCELDDPRQKAWYAAAKSGDASAAISLLRARRRHEYENVNEADVIDATQ